MRAALAHSATIAPPCTLGPMVQCSFSSPSKTRHAGLPGSESSGRSAIAVVNNAFIVFPAYQRSR
ncbi:Uncharacterised protein [Mycobacterium tuberculosis]|uniref:Uncharacterized protein n=1 Tax=Mycobacterium tuberculosis TaxID=1773 RepID=A0A654U7P3_MYCTX|nr:Uncharacterised protein [Mycobacterium tuberculosis]SGO73806.1 Uncharacterised protein [Mycobacterium tuberculosis]